MRQPGSGALRRRKEVKELEPDEDPRSVTWGKRESLYNPIDQSGDLDGEIKVDVVVAFHLM